MKTCMVCVLLGVLFGIEPRQIPAQQHQNTQKSYTEIETLKQRVSELDKQLRTVENVEKLDLQAKLAEANAKLLNSELGKFESSLRDANNKWLREWSYWFLSVIGIFVIILAGVSAVFWYWLRSRADRLIADEVEKNIDGFKEVLKEQNTIKNELVELAKAHAATVLWHIDYSSVDDEFYSGEIKVISDETLLQLFRDEKFPRDIICKAAKVLAKRKSPRLVSPAHKFLNSVLDSDTDKDNFPMELYLRDFVKYLEELNAHQVLKELLNRLMSENPRHKDLLLPPTIKSLADIGVKSNKGDWVAILRRSIPHLEVLQPGFNVLTDLAAYFGKFNETGGIKEILNYHGTNLPPEIIDKCLELLQRHDPEYVEKWRTQNAQDNAEST